MSQLELGVRDDVLDRLERDNAALLEWLRGELKTLYLRRAAKDAEQAFVYADDARRILSRHGIALRTNNVLGGLFCTREWVKDGRRIHSETQGSHGNELYCWRWREAA